MKCLRIESRRGNFFQEVARFFEELSEVRGRVGIAWKSTSAADNGDGFVASMHFDSLCRLHTTPNVEDDKIRTVLSKDSTIYPVERKATFQSVSSPSLLLFQLLRVYRTTTDLSVKPDSEGWERVVNFVSES